jgi:fructokinase
MKTRADENSKRTSRTVVGLGELIWDLLPEGKQLGGAPSNFAYISRLLGDSAVVASRTGADAFGVEARARLERMGISTAYLQGDGAHATGTVNVRIDEHGEPHFAVNENSAWDYLELTPLWQELAARADAVCFGTLGQRNPHARATITRFLQLTRADALRVFDVNLRHSFFDAGMLTTSLALSNVVKFNTEELSVAARMLAIEARDDRSIARKLLELFGVELVAVTRGARGSLLVTKERAVEHAGFPVRVADTIGAGDAFTAALTHFRMRRAPLEQINDAANRLGSWVASQSGATPAADPRVIRNLFGPLPNVKI